MRSSHRHGFTLIELLIVVVVVGILATLGIIGYSTVRKRSSLSSMQSDLRNLVVKQEIYYNDNYVYSLDETAIGHVGSPGVNLSINSADNTGWGATATHEGHPDLDCGVFVGTAPPADGAPATSPELVTCSE